MDLWSSLRGIVEVTLTSADTIRTLDLLQKNEIAVLDGTYIDPLHLRLSIWSKDFPRLIQICNKRGDTVEILHRKGVLFTLKAILKRPVLVIGILFIIVLSFWLPSRVLFVRVEGNSSISAGQIIEQAEVCGIRFCASRRAVRSEKMKNALLEAMPQLQWAGVNTYGCTAVITVHERNDLQQKQQSTGISNIVAIRDGVVRDITVLQGTALCTVGQAVKMGQVLVSGYTDCGICLKGMQAKAEIFGDTIRNLSVIIPTRYSGRGTQTSTKEKYSLILGKKRINLSKGSGISGSTCAKIYEENYLTLPGGFVLPIAIAKETSYEYKTQLTDHNFEEAMLTEFAAMYLSEQMIAGQITSFDSVYSQKEFYCQLDGIFGCYEMIGITRGEELIAENE